MKVTMIDSKAGKQKAMPATHAKILHKLGRATYMTRDMVAEPLVPVQFESPAAFTSPDIQPVESAGGEMDSAGTTWSADLHTSTKLKNADGTWRKRPGARAAD